MVCVYDISVDLLYSTLSVKGDPYYIIVNQRSSECTNCVWLHMTFVQYLYAFSDNLIKYYWFTII